MKRLLGIFLVTSGMILSLYVGLWLMFIGGITTIVNAVEMDPVNNSAVVWGIVQIVFSSLVGSTSSYVLIVPGFILLAKD